MNISQPNKFSGYFLHLKNPDAVGVPGLRALPLTLWLLASGRPLEISWRLLPLPREEQIFPSAMHTHKFSCSIQGHQDPLVWVNPGVILRPKCSQCSQFPWLGSSASWAQIGEIGGRAASCVGRWPSRLVLWQHLSPPPPTPSGIIISTCKAHSTPHHFYLSCFHSLEHLEKPHRHPELFLGQHRMLFPSSECLRRCSLQLGVFIALVFT